jgi:hypothetical protein
MQDMSPALWMWKEVLVENYIATLWFLAVVIVAIIILIGWLRFLTAWLQMQKKDRK